MVKAGDFTSKLTDIDREDVLLVGDKCASLAELGKDDIPISSGFAVTSHALSAFIRHNRLEEKITHLLGTIDFDDKNSVQKISGQIRRMMQRAEIPKEVVKEVFSSYATLGKRNVHVTVRASSTMENIIAERLHVKGEAAVVDAVREIWTSFYDARSVQSRVQNRRRGNAVLVQEAVEPDASGVIFTSDPSGTEKTKMVIEAVLGHSEQMYAGKVTPDYFEVEKASGEVHEKKISEQTVMLTKKGSETKEKKVSRLARKKQKISDLQIKNLVKIAQKVEKYFFFPQKIDWVLKNGRLYITGIHTVSQGIPGKKILGDATNSVTRLTSPIFTGDPASPGIGVGHVRILDDAQDVGKVQEGDVLVAPATNTRYTQAMRRASAIITEMGGNTSHAALIARELGIPAVVEAVGATKILKNNTTVTVNGSTGEIYNGSVVSTERVADIVHHSHVKTRTKVFLDVQTAETIKNSFKCPIDGVGPLHSEHILKEIGKHPKKILEDGKKSEFVKQFAGILKKYAQKVYPQPVIYCATDATTNEYRNLIGGRQFESYEPNPALGYHGTFRHIREPEVFGLELEAIKKVRKEYNNVHLAIPFVRTVKELQYAKEIIKKNGLSRSTTFKLHLIVAIPSNVISIEDLIDTGIDGIYIDAETLTMLTLGLDPKSEDVAVEFDLNNTSVLHSYEKVIKAAKEHKISSGMYGVPVLCYPDLIEKCMNWGMTSVTVTSHEAQATRDVIQGIERKK